MRMYVVRFTPRLPNTFLNPDFVATIYSGKEPTRHKVTLDDFKNAMLEDSVLFRLFNGDHNINGSFTLEMTDCGPIFNRDTFYADEIQIDGVRITRDPVPLGLPAQHRFTIGHLVFDLSIQYAE